MIPYCGEVEVCIMNASSNASWLVWPEGLCGDCS